MNIEKLRLRSCWFDLITLISCYDHCQLYCDLTANRRLIRFAVKLRIIVLTVFKHVVQCSQKHSCYGNDCFFMTATLFDTEIAVTNLRMLFAGNDSISTLHQQWLDIAAALETRTDFFFPTLSLLVGVSPAHEHRCFAEGKASILVPISEMIPMAVKSLLMPRAVWRVISSCW